MNYQKIFRFTLGICVAVFFLWLIFRQISVDQLLESFLNISAFNLVLAVVFFFIGYACRIRRWQLMLKQENAEVKWLTCSGPLFASVAANNVLPFRVGDIYRAFFFNSKLKISKTTSLMSLLVERLLDLLMVLVFLGLAIHYLKLETTKLIGVSHSIIFLMCVAILAFLIFPKHLKPISTWVVAKLEARLPKLGPKLREKLDMIFNMLNAISEPRLLCKLIGWSFLAWLLEGMVFFTMAKAIHAIQFPLYAWVALPVGTLATTIPSTPGYVGTFDYFVSQSMAIFGNTIESSTAYAFLLHAVLWLPVTLLGGAYIAFYTFGKKKSNIKNEKIQPN